MMKVRELFDKAVEIGRLNDPRGPEAVEKELARRRKDYEKMDEKDREFYDASLLENPYADSKLLSATGDEEVGAALVGIDIEVGEVLLAHALRGRGVRLDLIIAHHPEGAALADLYRVMDMQAGILAAHGVSISAAESLMEGRIKDVERRLMPGNHTRAVEAARLLGIPMINLHTPADNMVVAHLQGLFDEKRPDRISDVLELLMEIPEYRHARMLGQGPKVLLGSEGRSAGRIFVDMTGGTEGAKDIFASIAQSGINTLVCMHLSDDHRKEAEKHHLNVVIAGHISSDNVGLNLLFDGVEAGCGPLELLECSGFKRFRRV